MMKFFYIICLSILPILAPAQNDSDTKSLNFQFEAFGNGTVYSIGVEFFTQKKKNSSGDRIGLSFFPYDNLTYYGMFYEKNWIFGRKKTKLELGLGSAFFYYPWYSYYSSYSPYSNRQEDTFKYRFYLTNRLGVRYDVNETVNLRLGALMFTTLNAIDDNSTNIFAPWFALSIGYKIK